jgi:hypothetical protein
MSNDTRRLVLKGCLACAAAAVVPRAIPQEGGGGCDWSSAGARGIAIVGAELAGSTGDPQQDKALGLALVRLSQLFAERPGFGFYDDSDAPNAKADPETGVAGTWGTVLFGTRLFKDLMTRFDDRGVTVLAVTAHEFGHIAQFHRGIFGTLNEHQRTVKKSELHADLLAGFFLGNRKMDTGTLRIRTAGVALYQIGDYGFNSPDHHGTPEERVAAAEYGYSFAARKASFNDTFNKGMEWVLSQKDA